MTYADENPFKDISILYRKSHIWLNNDCTICGLTAAQALVILVLCDFGSLTQDEMTKVLSLDKSVVAKTVSKLDETGFLTRRKNTGDKRTYDLFPTEKAKSVHKILKEKLENVYVRMTQKMTDGERKEFKRLLALASSICLEADD